MSIQWKVNQIWDDPNNLINSLTLFMPESYSHMLDMKSITIYDQRIKYMIMYKKGQKYHNISDFQALRNEKTTAEN